MFSLTEYFPASGDVDQTITVERQLEGWLDSQRVEESTKAGYKAAIKFWVAALPGKPLKALKLSEILKVVAARGDLSGKTVNNYISVLRQSLDLAVRDHVLQANPATEVPRVKHQKEPPDPFTRDESDKIIAEALAKHPGQVHNFVEFWFWTGLRTSEIFGLTWENVDLASGTILVAEAVVRGIHKNRTKTNTTRTVKLNSRALAAIQRQRHHTQVSGGAVFQDPRYGTSWVDERAFRRSYWTPILKRMEIRYRRPYNMRHSYATAMLMAGMTPAFCAKQLGHSIEMFLRTYSKWLDGAQNDLEMQRLEASLSPGYPR
jgi:integrase